MPFQPMNFANIPAEGFSALRNLVGDVKGGMETGMLPEKMRSELALKKAQSAEAQGKADKMNVLMNAIRQRMGQGGGGQQPGVGQQPMAGGTGVGANAQMPSQIQQAGQLPGAQTQQAGGQMDPLVNAWLNKEIFGQVELPQEESQRKFQDKMRQTQYEETRPTTQNLTDMRKRMQKSAGFADAIGNLLKSPTPASMGVPFMDSQLTLHPTQLAQHNRAVSSALEHFLAMKGWDKEAQTKIAEKILERSGGESEYNYKKQVLEEAQKAAKNFLPTYEQLGQKPPQDLVDLAEGRLFTDVVEKLKPIEKGGHKYVRKGDSWHKLKK